MNIDDYVEGKDLDHLIVSELKLGSKLQNKPWAESGSGSFILDELVQNGEFDLDTTYWTSVDAALLGCVANGKVGNCLAITEAGADHPRVIQVFACEPETEYLLDFYIKPGTEDYFRVFTRDPDDGYQINYDSGFIQAVNQDWNNRHLVKFTTNPCQRRIRLDIQTQTLNGEGFTMYFDRVSIQPVRRVPLLGGEVVGFSIDGDGTEREVFSLADVDAGSSGEHLWYCEEDERLRLYAHPADGDSPGHYFSGPVYKYCVEASWWNGFCNRKRTDKSPLILQRYDELLLNSKLDLWDSATDIRNFTEVIVGGTSTITRDTDTFDDFSAYAAKITIDAGGNDAYYYQSIQTKPNRKHSIFIRYKTGASGGARLRVRNIGGDVYLDSNGEWQAVSTVIGLPTSETYTTFEIEFITHPDYSSYQVVITHSAASSISWVDRLSFRRHRKPIGYLQLLDSNSIPAIYQGVGDYYQGDIRIEFGTTKYLNDGWWYDRKGVWLFHNRENLIKVGDADSEWDELEQIFTGIIRNPSWKDKYWKCNVKDSRIAELTKIPRTRFGEDYPDIENSYANKIIPVLLGYKTNITPIRENGLGSSPYRFKVSETWFNGVNIEMEDVAVNVYKDDRTLVNGVDYIKDNANGRFTLTVDPGDALITCDSKGLKCDFEDGTYSTNVADFTHFIMVRLGDVSEERLNIASFLALKAARTQNLALYINTEREALSEIKKLVQSCTFHLLPMLDGNYMTSHFTADILDTIDRWNTEDLDDFEVMEKTDQAFKEVVIQYDQDPTTGNWLQVYDENICTEAIHKIKNVLILQTALISSVEAESLRDFYLDMIADPPDKIQAMLPVKSLLYYPTVQAVFNRQYIEEKKNETVDILVDEVYRLLEITKNAHEARSEVVGVRNVQASGLGSAIHSDSPHEDHSDSVHSDTPHADGHADSYSDVPHSDGYGDTPYEDHTDEFHLDVPYVDAHIDNPHEDSHTDYHEDEYTDEYTDHEDGPYTDSHDDSYNDFYTDVPHVDHTDQGHYDSPYQDHDDDQPHEDTPHEDAYTDIPYEDVHTDEAHGDSPHVDSHTDLHDDVPHADSYV